jgi:hypothetical protein
LGNQKWPLFVAGPKIKNLRVAIVVCDCPHERRGTSFPWRARSLKIAAECQVKIYPLAEAGGADGGKLDLRGKVFPSKTQGGEHVDLALFQLRSAEFHGVGAARNCVGQRTFTFAQVVIASESIFDILKRAQRHAYIGCRSSFLLGGAEILRGLEFPAEKDRLRDPGRETPDDGI